MPKSGEQEVNVAPRLVAASIAITVSGRFGRKAATTSPGPTPSRASPVAMRATSERSACQRQLAPVTALVAEHDRGLGVRPAQQVLGKVEPCAREPARAGHALAVLERGTRAAFAARRPQNAHNASQNAPGCSTDQR